MIGTSGWIEEQRKNQRIADDKMFRKMFLAVYGTVVMVGACFILAELVYRILTVNDIF